MRLSLRSHSITFTVLAGTLTFVTVLALALTTTRMERSSARMLQEVEEVRATSALWSALLYHEQEQRLFQATGLPAHGVETRRMTGEVRQRLARVRQLASTPEESALLDTLQGEVEAYLAHPAPRAGGEEEEGGRALAQERELLLGLVDLHLSRAHHILAANQRWGRTFRLLGLGVLLLLGVAVALLLWSMRQHVLRPLQAVRGALLRFHPGHPFRPAPEAGVQEIRDISRTFNEAASALERQRQLSLGFLSGVAHDLRNPLQALRTAAASMRPGRPLPPEEKVRERFALVERQAARLNRMVEDLLDTTRIEAGQLSLELGEHDLVELVREAVELHRPLSDAHVLETSFPHGPVWARCDSTRLSQVLNNLLSNAIKYSPEGGAVRVEVGADEEGEWVAVSDRGIGIPADERESIFEPFRRSTLTRGGPGASAIPGVGLGLSVARRILQAHGGSIEVESEPGRGSTFRVRLPPGAPSPRREDAQQGPAATAPA